MKTRPTLPSLRLPWQPNEAAGRQPYRGELLSLERLEEYARELAIAHKAETRRAPAIPALSQLEASIRTIEAAFMRLSAVAHRKAALLPGEEWLLDNYHIVQDNISEVRVDLPRRYYLELPRLAGGPWAGYPRVYALAWELIGHTDGVVNSYYVEAFVRGYQSVIPLTTGELWATPIMLRLALIEDLAHLAGVLVQTRSQLETADRWADHLLTLADAVAENHGGDVQLPPGLRRRDALLTPAFVARFVQRLRDGGPAVESVLSWLQSRMAAKGTSVDEVVRAEFGNQSALQASVGNTIVSMRTIAATNWMGFVEQHSLVEALLREDPASVYSSMDFATRNRYRGVVERIARRSRISEGDVASTLLQLARAAHSADPGDMRRSHVGYYLIAIGVHQLRRAVGYRSRLGEVLSRAFRRNRTALYLGAITVVACLFLALVLFFGMDRSSANATGWWILAGLLALFPAGEFAVYFVNQAVTLLLQPRVLPKLDFSGGIPAEQRTFVVIPTLVSSCEDALALIEHVELLYFASPGPNLHFAILSDFTDAPAEEMPGDAELLESLSTGVRNLNVRYGTPDRFYLFHRKRQWNPKESVWMGWERKRGKLADFNGLIRGRISFDPEQNPFSVTIGDISLLSGVKYVITLDRDTEMPRDTAHRLVGTLAHPLNRAEIDPVKRIVARGYGILQPRVSTTWQSSVSSYFSRIFSGHTGVDPYTTAVSNAYQDLFSEGIYIGKGIYDVEAFEATTEGRFPTNALLSHDLLEGSYTRVGFASDIELYEDFPARQNVFAAREHRWVRGDWQILPWLFPRVPTTRAAPEGNPENKGDNPARFSLLNTRRTERNPLSIINRWKILDNLRRSLVAPASVVLLALSWTLLPGSPLSWTLAVLAVIAFPLYSHILTSAWRKPPAATWARHLSAVTQQARINLLSFILTTSFLVYRSHIMVNAVVTTLVRMYITHRCLLEWTTASEAQRTLGSEPLAFWKRMWQSSVVAALLPVAVVFTNLPALPVALPLLTLWLVAPELAYWISRPIVAKVYNATAAERAYLRRVARKSWRYFEEFTGPGDLWLAPDNYQEEPSGVLAHRTSPTNLGLLLISTLSAHDMGYLTKSELAARLDCTLKSMEGLEKYNGHFYNWYDTLTGKALPPKYISTVDSGNLIGHLLALKQGCGELPNRPIFTEQTLLGLCDITSIISEELKFLRERREVDIKSIEGQLKVVSDMLVKTPASLHEWLALFRSLLHPATNLATELRRRAGVSGPRPQDVDRHNGKSRPVGAERSTPDTGTLQLRSMLDDLAFWAERLVLSVRSGEEEIRKLVPCTLMTSSPHPLLQSDSHPEIADQWSKLREFSEPVPSLRGNLVWSAGRIAEIRRLQLLIREKELGADGAAAIQWLEKLRQAVSSGWSATEVLLGEARTLASRIEAIVGDMHFGFLMDYGRKLFSIGYNVSELRLDHSYYDLLASEARLASYLSIARGEAPREHWFVLGRPLTGHGDNLTLLSWSGTMFEYLMPNLVMATYSGTLLAQATSGAVRRQEHYGRTESVPWGISEAAYNSLDPGGSYSYKAFGVPDLGLKRGLSDDLVVAPYATLLALPVDPQHALSNLRRLSNLGMEGRYGFYESLDFTRSRLAPGERAARVGTFMVHHVGMGLVAVNNYLHDNLMVRRFHSEPLIRSSELLLQERTPMQAPLTLPHPVEIDRQRTEREVSLPVMRSYDTPYTNVPRAHLLSNGRYSVMLTNSGAGYSSWKELAITRWRNDSVLDAYGSFIYIADLHSGKVWSAAAAPLGGQPEEYNASFQFDKVEFRRRDGDIETHTEIVVSPEDDAEVRRVTLTNRGNRLRVLELTSYAEVVLGSQGGDKDAPAFSKLFVETEYSPEYGALLATRRPRSASDPRNWLVHVLSINREGSTTTSVLGSPVPEHYETDRALFLGRGGTPSSPAALKKGHSLNNSAGAVLDPIFSLRQRVRIGPGMRVRVTFTTAAAASREQAVSLIDKYHDPVWSARAMRMALTRERIELRQLGLSGDAAMQYQRLFSRMIYPMRGTRPSAETLARNVKGQQGLWAYGISGDLPLLLVRVSELSEVDIVREALHAHEYWRNKGFKADLVILNEYPGGYIQPVQDELEQIVNSSHARDLLNKTSGVYVKRADIMPEADRILLSSVSRVILIGGRGNLAAQLDRQILGPESGVRLVETAATSAQRSRPPSPPSSPTASYPSRTPHSAFSADGHEYLITLDAGEWTPLPWTNVIANPRFGCMATESSLGSSWAENSRQNRLTPWSNDPVSDPPAEAIYIRDDETGRISTPTPLPMRDNSRYTVCHGQGYTIYGHSSDEVEQTLRIFVAADDPVKICKLTLRNASARRRRLSVTYYAEWVMGVDRDGFARYVITESDAAHGAILARNPYNAEFADRVAFAATSAEACTITADRRDFLGRDGSLSNPAALRGRQKLSGHVGAGFDPCAALQCALELAPGEERTILFTLGEGENAQEARTLAARYRAPEAAESAYAGVLQMWDRLLSAVEVSTPDRNMDLIVNRWLLYQAVSCRYWGRSAFYQGGGAYGFRDQLQDVMALVYAAPEIAREHILRCAEHQFKEGDVQHWWHPPGGRGVRTHFSDDLLWLPFVTAYYVAATGDSQILDESRPFLEAPLLKPDEEDMYSLPAISEEAGTLYEHCLRAIRRGTTSGAHGLPLMGTGDWNDGMNRVGSGGKGESVWVGWFLYAVLLDFLPLCQARGDEAQVANFRDESARLKAALEDHAWDGKWYLRAYYDDGTPLGSSKSEECKIDAIAQSWSVISGAGDSARTGRAMKSLEERLLITSEEANARAESEAENGLLLLLAPPFDKGEHDPGYIKGYPPGVRENGGQYTHAAIWSVVAKVLMGDGDGAYDLFKVINPINHATTPEEIELYKVEPYVIAADVYSHPQHLGRGGWTWYTGSASWFYRLAVEYILGLKRRGDALVVEPCIPSSWPGYSMIYRFGKSSYRIAVENSNRLCRGVSNVEIDGVPQPDSWIKLVDDEREHNVRVVLVPKEAQRTVAVDEA